MPAHDYDHPSIPRITAESLAAMTDDDVLEAIEQFENELRSRRDRIAAEPPTSFDGRGPYFKFAVHCARTQAAMMAYRGAGYRR